MQETIVFFSAYRDYCILGDHHAGNNAGRIIKQQDASGVQTFEYGKLGELIKNNHTFVVPGGVTYTFAMNWTYDSWNRLINITYPDGELVKYRYNLGGQLYSVEGTKTTRSYNYLNSVTYDKYGNRYKVENGNGTSLKYTYDQTTLRLSNLKSYNAFGEMMQDINYVYDNVSNITQIKNNASVMTNGLGGNSEYNYQYDDIYRLENANGIWDKKNFSLAMQYSASGNILNKTQYAQTSINGSAVTINYNRGYNYSGSQPHAISDINNQNLRFEWDANGNMTRYYNDLEKLKRNQCWDEENRLIAVYDDNKQLSNYLYDAAGERVWKLGGRVQRMLINNEQTVNFADMNENKTLYANPYMVVNDREYTKHYYTEGQRIASKIGAGLLPSIVSYTEKIEPITEDTYGMISDHLYKLCQLSNDCVGFNGEYSIYPKTIKCIKPLAELDKEEPDLYFYHSDHIGSSSFITDRNGYASQHLQYLPFGELFVEQRSTANYYTPYKFSGKEKDEETSYSYFGARYYMSDVSVWLSVDPLADDAPGWTPYRYCFNNPINLIDPDGNFEGDFWGLNGAHLGSDGIADNKAYVTDKKTVDESKGDWDKVKSSSKTIDLTKKYGITNSQLLDRAHWAFGEAAIFADITAHAINNLSILGESKMYKHMTCGRKDQKGKSPDQLRELAFGGNFDSYYNKTKKKLIVGNYDTFTALRKNLSLMNGNEYAKLAMKGTLEAIMGITTDPTNGAKHWGGGYTNYKNAIKTGIGTPFKRSTRYGTYYQVYY